MSQKATEIEVEVKKHRNRPEILAPAGSLESLKGAVAAGADAVYIGGSRFGARAYADNPEQDTLLSAIDYVHSKDRRIYLTVNTLLKEEELTKELYAFLEGYYRAGIDAVIVQDVGVLHFLATHFPELPVHASTQMTLVSADGVNWFQDYPVTRLVPARELSFEEIAAIRKKTELEIECFVHGALCYCYSGQCLFSSMIGGRSGNRGRCAQPCRMPYTVSEDGRREEGRYVLSPKDLCTLDMIPKLVETGIDSFKIEGRMKRPEYTAGVTAAYRMMTDLYTEYGEEEFFRYVKKHPNLIAEQMERVADLYNRGGFTKGYYVQYHGESMMSMERPNHSGVKVGEVERVQGIRAGIRLLKDIYPQDVLEIRSGTQEIYEFTVGKAGIDAGNRFYETNVKKGFPLKKGQEVYRTKRECLLEELRTEYVEHEVQMPVIGEFVAKVSEPVRFRVSACVHEKSSLHPGEDEKTLRTVTVEVTGEEVAEAKSQPVTKEKVAEQLKKTGESACYFKELNVVLGGNCFLPVGKIKELRRTAFEKLTGAILEGYHRKLPENPKDGMEEEPCETKDMQDFGQTEIIVLVSTLEQLQCVMKDERVTTLYLDLQNEPLFSQLQFAEEAKQSGKRIFLVLPHIFREKEKRRYEKEIKRMQTGVFDGFLAKSLEELTFLEENDLRQRKEIRLNYNLYAFQSEAKKFFSKAGFGRFTAPVELNEEELRKYDVSDCDFIVYGRLPLMVSAQCVRENVWSCMSGKKTEGITLTDRMGVKFPVRQICTSCYNVIYNSACFSLLGTEAYREFSPAGYRLDFVFESEKEMGLVLDAFFCGTKIETDGALTRGHFKRGIE